MFKKLFVTVVAFAIFPVTALASDIVREASAEHGAAGGVCMGFGPQTPRDIDSRKGQNKRVFTKAPSYKEMNLCNLHFHVNAEHKAKSYSIHVEGEHGADGGFQCGISKQLSTAEMAPTATPISRVNMAP